MTRVARQLPQEPQDQRRDHRREDQDQYYIAYIASGHITRPWPFRNLQKVSAKARSSGKLGTCYRDLTLVPILIIGGTPAGYYVDLHAREVGRVRQACRRALASYQWALGKLIAVIGSRV